MKLWHVVGTLTVALLCSSTVARASNASPAPLAPTTSCAALVKAAIGPDVGAGVSIHQASETTIDGARYCQVAGTIDKRIKFELRLPVSGWTQRYVQVGCGGLCGSLQIRLEHADECRPALDHSIALASTDMGHEGKYLGDGSFGEDPQARIDFAYRGVHLTALAAKALIRAYYGKAARYAYFTGCSDGGREALMEAQRFPGDFDGIAAGAPAMNFQVQNSFYHAWMYVANHRADGSAILTASKLPALHAAALASCDAVDGLKDGLIADPRACHFNPSDAVCGAQGAQQNGCLTREEADVARKFYDGPRDESGRRLTIGGPQVGSELAWRGVFVPEKASDPVMSEDAALGTLRYLAFEHNPGAAYTIKDFHFDSATFERLAPLHVLYDATDTDLSRFQARGGKLLLWHGWSDPHISPLNTIAYYESVRAQLGSAKADGFMRLFLFPGMYHCGGGDGFSAFDNLSPLMAWVEEGSAPATIVARHEAMQFPPGPPPGAHGGPGGNGPPPGAPPPPPPGARPGPGADGARARPIYPYPALPRYVGRGPVDDAASYTSGDAVYTSPAKYDWAGAVFMTPGFHRDCAVSDGSVRCR